MFTSNELCKKLNEESHHHATLPECQRYNAHFDYYDLVTRLNKLREQREQNSQPLVSKLELHNLTTKISVISNSIKNIKKPLGPTLVLNNALSERIQRQGSDLILPIINSPKAIGSGNKKKIGISVENKRMNKYSSDIKLKIGKRRQNLRNS